MNSEMHALRLQPKLMSFDVFGTLISVRDSSYGAFERILADTGAHHIDVKPFWKPMTSGITGKRPPSAPMSASQRARAGEPEPTRKTMMPATMGTQIRRLRSGADCICSIKG